MNRTAFGAASGRASADTGHREQLHRRALGTPDAVVVLGVRLSITVLGVRLSIDDFGADTVSLATY